MHTLLDFYQLINSDDSWEVFVKIVSVQLGQHLNKTRVEIKLITLR